MKKQCRTVTAKEGPCTSGFRLRSIHNSCCCPTGNSVAADKNLPVARERVEGPVSLRHVTVAILSGAVVRTVLASQAATRCGRRQGRATLCGPPKCFGQKRK